MGRGADIVRRYVRDGQIRFGRLGSRKQPGGRIEGNQKLVRRGSFGLRQGRARDGVAVRIVDQRPSVVGEPDAIWTVVVLP